MLTSRIILVSLACAAAVGCGSGGLSVPKTAPVSGTVLVKGKPVAGVKVTFHPQFDMGSVKFTPIGETNKEGRFTVNTGAGGAGAPPGDYVVTFELLRGGADKSGQDIEVDAWKGKHADPAKSPFKVTINSGDNALEPFKLD